MSNVTNILTFRKRPAFNMPYELKPKIIFRKGLWRVQKSRGLTQNALDANNNALLFVVYKNQFLDGGCFGKEKEDQ